MNEQENVINANLLRMLRCPKEGDLLAIADDSLIQKLNEQIKRGELRDAQDQKIQEPIEAALVTASGSRVYPIRGGIPTLIADEAIEL